MPVLNPAAVVAAPPVVGTLMIDVDGAIKEDLENTDERQVGPRIW